MVTYKLLEGTKYQVFKGIAKQTSGGLKKADIVKVTKDGVTRYRSKKQTQNGSSRNKVSQQGRQSWSAAYKKALMEISKTDEYYKTNILMFVPGKTYDKKFSNKTIKMGEKLYVLTKKYHTA